ncbi:MAG TPA: hypothetical protein VMY77_08015, partial [Chitinophagaceae bacterium]|nr:hypothetical protein [Chitinophagaceae bacterium]
HRKRKIEKMRIQALEAIDKSLGITGELPYYKGDNSLRKSSMDYIKFCYSVFNEDYNKIVNMEEIAEQSYDAMQAFLLLQEKTDEKIKQANAQMHEASKAFAAKYNVNLISQKDELDEKIGQAGSLTRYTNNVYLVFFKCFWQDGEIVKAMNTGKLTAVEQGRTSLIRFATEGLQALDTLKSFAGDPALANSCKRVLNFYKKMAENDLPKQMDYFLKKENFEKIKKAYEGKSSPTKADVDAFNAAVKDVNNSMNTFNNINSNVNNTRNEVLKDWNETEKSFADSHMPYYK